VCGQLAVLKLGSVLVVVYLLSLTHVNGEWICRNSIAYWVPSHYVSGISQATQGFMVCAHEGDGRVNLSGDDHFFEHVHDISGVTTTETLIYQYSRLSAV
jgi:hypothetical protein